MGRDAPRFFGIISPVPKWKAPEDLTEEELRWLLVEKRRMSRQQRLENYRRSGRLVVVASDLESPGMESWRSQVLEEAVPARPPRGRRILDSFLLLVEISAFIGFIFILFNGLSLIQEINREANTIGSKANDAAIAHVVVEIKSELEKVREQIQNVE